MDIGEKTFCDESGEALELVFQRACGCPIIGSVQGLVEWGYQQLDLVESVPASCRGVKIDDIGRSLSTRAILCFSFCKRNVFISVHVVTSVISCLSW